MKTKTYLIFTLAIIVAISVGIWAYYSINDSFTFTDIAQLLVIYVLVIFAVYFGLRRLPGIKRGQPAEDEMSKKLTQKAASTAFYISLYLWLAISYFTDGMDIPGHTLIGGGILGMAIIFALSWFFYKLRGV